ncbi:hypothetical protein D9757_014013 [Collybiopsis confluens]|uniref:Uncharacterized protein n=1 Tax=Collybiopsis confluens TaxID=2823264 RepID=A0A8H5FZH7_9AGAR|nr:hypothetical protein D9757_014013 [Collybiopsis confluens]
MPSRRLKGLFGISLALSIPLAQAAQIPTFVDQPHFISSFHPLENDDKLWDIKILPNVNATGHLVFETVNSLLQHWPNTRYRNGGCVDLFVSLVGPNLLKIFCTFYPGHNIVPGTVSPGTVLYHGRGDSGVPEQPEWLATDPEHASMFCRPRSEDSGCWMLMVTPIRPLHILYFDGSSAAKMPDGAMDSQDIFTFGRVAPDKYWDERGRINALCKRFKGLGVDGFVRMEMDFEIMLCDFADGVEVEALNLRASPGGRRGPPPGGPGRIPDRPDTSYAPFDGPPQPLYPENSTFNSPFAPKTGNAVGEAFISGAWHNFYPGDTRIKLDLTRLVSLYDTSLVPSLVQERFGKPRIEHRLLGISDEDLNAVVGKVEELSASRGAVSSDAGGGSEIDWGTLIRLVVKRFSDRLETIQYLLNSTAETGGPARQEQKKEDVARALQARLQTMLQPYLLNDIKPPTEVDADKSLEWVSPLYERCSTTYTSYITSTPSLYARLTPSETLILGGVEETTREICRVVVGMWGDGVMTGLDPKSYVPSGGQSTTTPTEDELNELLESWIIRIDTLMKWLDWIFGFVFLAFSKNF